jgi:hypothetical protein
LHPFPRCTPLTPTELGIAQVIWVGSKKVGGDTTRNAAQRRLIGSSFVSRVVDPVDQNSSLGECRIRAFCKTFLEEKFLIVLFLEFRLSVFTGHTGQFEVGITIGVICRHSVSQPASLSNFDTFVKVKASTLAAEIRRAPDTHLGATLIRMHPLTTVAHKCVTTDHRNLTEIALPLVDRGVALL